jgi:hypothetical protein
MFFAIDVAFTGSQCDTRNALPALLVVVQCRKQILCCSYYAQVQRSVGVRIDAEAAGVEFFVNRCFLCRPKEGSEHS